MTKIYTLLTSLWHRHAYRFRPTALILAAALLMPVLPARAFPTDTYAESSRLASGRWVKIGVENSGVYCISRATLRSWGFSNPERVRIHGYGGRRMPDVLSTSNYIDDLPPVQSVLTDKGVVFYATGAGEWVQSTGSYYHYDLNIYSTTSYYFVTESDEEIPAIEQVGNAEPVNPVEYFLDRIHYEKEIESPGEAGALLAGEDFKNTRSRNFNFTLTDPMPEVQDGWLECSFISNTLSGGQLAFTHNNSPLSQQSSDRIQATSTSVYVCGTETTARHTFKPDASGKATIGITFSASGIVNGAWLNYLTLNYPRSLKLPASGSLEFWSNTRELRLSGTREGTVVWDVTAPGNILALRTGSPADASGVLQWRASYSGMRSYVAWHPQATLPEPVSYGTVDNQDLHAAESTDMVIITPLAYLDQAERLANLHRGSADPITVQVVNVDKIYNEFGSGSPDVAAIRHYLKMLHDRGKEGIGKPLRYAVLLARTTFDNRRLTSVMKKETYPTIPGWMPRTVRSGLSENEGYSTDDFIALLDDNSGSDMGLDDISIAVGRIPATSATDVRNAVDKISDYMAGLRRGAWKHRFMFLADDQDNGTHLDQTENIINGVTATEGQQHLIRKVYMDAFQKVGGKYPEARNRMYRYLDEGVVWWNFVGHANETGWTGEGQLSYTDLNNMFLRHWPFIYAATCDFLRFDASKISGAEIIYFERYGGAIGIISATRPVYISDNGLLSEAMGRTLACRDENGRFLTAGEIYRRAKNNILSSDGVRRSNSNRLRYVFMGDPALHLAIPDNLVTIDKVRGADIDPENPPVLAALEICEISGRVTAPDGTPLPDFNGTLLVDIYDAEKSVTTLGNGENGVQSNFEEYGDRIFTGSTRVVNGQYTLRVAMPAEISQNFRPATVSLYAYPDGTDTSSALEAVGLNRELYVYGYDDTAAPDTTPPVISSLVLNHSTFTSGSTVNASPMLIAEVSDDVALNLSGAGIGHQMTAILDGNKAYADLPLYFTPSVDGSPSGTINYTLENLTSGAHSLMLRVWDTAGNSTTSEIDFFVDPEKAPKIYDIYSDANPAYDMANFYLSHDQPDATVNVTVTVYNLLGKPVWESRQSGRSDMFLTVPVSWNLTDYSGRRVQRGIYLYRARIDSGSDSYETASRRIAVAAGD